MMVRGLLLLLATLTFLQAKPQLNPDSRPEIYPFLVDRFNAGAVGDGDVVFIGNSITFWGDWKELSGSNRIKNYGIPGDHTYGILARLDDVISAKPSIVFLMAGINDLAGQLSDSLIIAHLKEIVLRVQQGSPKTKIYVQSILPTNPKFGKLTRHYGHEDRIRSINQHMQEFANVTDRCIFIDLHTHFLDEAGYLQENHTWDGVHLNVSGYELWRDLLIENGYLVLSDLKDYPNNKQMFKKAKDDLISVLYHEERWIKVHAAEFLIWESQSVPAVREEFLKENERFGDIPQYRIGIWRVLAQAALNDQERAVWVNKIVEVYANENNTDRLHAIESLAKLQHSILDRATMDQISHKTATSFELYQLWNLFYQESIDQELLKDHLLSMMERQIKQDPEHINLLVSSYILRSLPYLSIAQWQRLDAISQHSRKDSELQASLFSTLWVLHTPEVDVEKLAGIRSAMIRTLGNAAHDMTGVNQVMLAFAKRASEKDESEILNIFEVLSDRQNPNYNADFHASAAYLVLSLINSQLNKAHDK